MRILLVIAVMVMVMVLGIGLSSEGKAGVYLDGNKVHEMCQSDQMKDICIGYVAGAFDAFEVMHLGENIPRRWCPPKAPLSQLVDVFTKWLVDHPEDRHINASALLAAAFVAKFPCNN
jgi:hypothetical protein